jgi:hypothetical protein
LVQRSNEKIAIAASRLRRSTARHWLRVDRPGISCSSTSKLTTIDPAFTRHSAIQAQSSSSWRTPLK